MDLASVIILVFLLVFSIIGYCKGMIAIILQVCKRIAAIIVSYFLAKPVGTLIFNTGAGEYLTDNIQNKLSSSIAASNMILTSENANEVVGIALTEINIPDFLHNIIRKIVFNNISECSGQTLGYYISNAFSTLACTVLAFIILMIFVNILFFSLRKIFKGINRIPFVGLVNRLGGFALNLLFAWLIISVGFWAISFVSTFLPEVNEFCNKYIIGNGDQMTLARWFYEHNLATILYIRFIK